MTRVRALEFLLLMFEGVIPPNLSWQATKRLAESCHFVRINPAIDNSFTAGENDNYVCDSNRAITIKNKCSSA